MRVPLEVLPRNVVIETNLDASEAREVLLSHISASAIEAVCLLTVDPLDLKTIMEIVSRRRFVGVDDRILMQSERG